MTVTHKINIDLTRGGIIPGIKATQGDANTRQLEITLQTDSAEWAVPEETNISVAFRNLRDGHKGWYDQLPDGTAACSFNGNVVTAILAPAVLSSAGDVKVAVVLQDASLNQLATFGVTVTVEPNPAAGASISNDYYRYTSMEAIDEAVDTWLTETEAEKNDFLAKAEEALTTIREVVTTGENAPAIVSDVTGECIAVSDASDRLLRGLTIYGKTTQSGTPSPDAPVELVSAGSGGSITSGVTGKNIIDFSNLIGFNGTWFNERIIDGQNVITIDADTSEISWATVGTDDTEINVSGRYTFSAYVYVPSTVIVRIAVFDGYAAIGESNQTLTPGWHRMSTSVSLTANKEYKFAVGEYSDGTIDISFNRCMVEFGDTMTEYEPFKGIQSIAVSTPNGLPGIPVPSGGNYTDERGQQWISDEIDLARGVYVQRVAFHEAIKLSDDLIGTSSNGLKWKISMGPGAGSFSGNGESAYRFLMSDRFPVVSVNAEENIETGNCMAAYGHEGGLELRFRLLKSDYPTAEAAAEAVAGAITMYPLAVPIETPLSAEELAAFAAIHSNYPNTTVYNDAGAGMKVSYVADTKRYIDNKFAALSAAIVNNA